MWEKSILCVDSTSLKMELLCWALAKYSYSHVANTENFNLIIIYLPIPKSASGVDL